MFQQIHARVRQELCADAFIENREAQTADVSAASLTARRERLALPTAVVLERGVTRRDGPEENSRSVFSVCSSSQTFAQLEQSFMTDRRTRRVVTACLGQSLNCGDCLGSSGKNTFDMHRATPEHKHKRLAKPRKQDTGSETEHDMRIGSAVAAGSGTHCGKRGCAPPY